MLKESNTEVINNKENYIAESYVPNVPEEEIPRWGSSTIKHQSIKLCMICGQPFYGTHYHFYCPSCAEDRKANKPAVTKICKDCGSEFISYHKERRCPKCVERAKQEANMRYLRNGTQRPLGSIDKCELCGKEYIVTSGSKKYCSVQCRRISSLPKQKEYRRTYYRTSKLAAEYRQRCKTAPKMCLYCLQPFTSDKSTNVCSDYCRSEHKKIVRHKSLMKYGLKNNYKELLEKREQYREQVKNENFQEAL